MQGPKQDDTGVVLEKCHLPIVSNLMGGHRGKVGSQSVEWRGAAE